MSRPYSSDPTVWDYGVITLGAAAFLVVAALLVLEGLGVPAP